MLSANDLGPWDWRLRVGLEGSFDSEIATSIDRLAHDGWQAEAEILRDIAGAHRRQVVLMPTIEAIEQGGGTSLQLRPDLNTDNLVGLPAELSEVVKSRLHGIRSQVSREVFDRLRDLIDAASSIRWEPGHMEILEIVFGEVFPELTSHLSNGVGDTQPDPPSQLDRDVLSEFIASYSSELRQNAAWEIPAFDLKITDDEGFAEYWPRESVDSERDLLAVSGLLEDARDAGTLKATLAHELAGHGAFYEFVRDLRPPFFDHGALGLVEGWATSEEWRLTGRGQGGRSTVPLLAAREENLRELCEEAVSRAGYSMKRVTNAMLSWAQYPAFQASYAYGAAWFELARRNSPDEAVLSSLTNRPLGDFFREWQHLVI